MGKRQDAPSFTPEMATLLRKTALSLKSHIKFNLRLKLHRAKWIFLAVLHWKLYNLSRESRHKCTRKANIYDCVAANFVRKIWRWCYAAQLASSLRLADEAKIQHCSISDLWLNEPQWCNTQSGRLGLMRKFNVLFGKRWWGGIYTSKTSRGRIYIKYKHQQINILVDHISKNHTSIMGFDRLIGQLSLYIDLCEVVCTFALWHEILTVITHNIVKKCRWLRSQH